jgi:acetate kinase
MSAAILTVNAGSSSIKFALFATEPVLHCIANGAIEKAGTGQHFYAHDDAGRLCAMRDWPDHEAVSPHDLLTPLIDWVTSHLGDCTLVAIGHRIVHGGTAFSEPVDLSPAHLRTLEELSPLAPLHQPASLAAIKAMMNLRPLVRQIGCFDTAFHHGADELVTRLALPRQYFDQGVRRYRFHGISYEYIARRLRVLAPALAAGYVIAAHLGNGASVCAMKDGRSVDSSMGFTALDGLIMGTRCGTIDPGVLLYLCQTDGMTPDQVSHLLYDKSGLLGISGISSDMRILLASADAHAAQAVAIFVYRAAYDISALIASLGGLDCIVFTAGIGAHAPAIRAAICARLAWLGIIIDDECNQNNATIISAPNSKIQIMVIPTDEQAMIAQHCVEHLART